MTSNGKHIPSALAVGLFFFLFVTVAFYDKAWAPPPAQPYTTSAHGSSAFGVKRSAAELADYSQGNCAHCHEQHTSIKGVEPAPVDAAFSPPTNPYALFAPTDPTSQTVNVCFDCHVDPGGQQSGGGIPNYNYGTNFGGGPIVATSVFNAFQNVPNAGSSHSLNQISTFIQAQWPATFKAESNPCGSCHNPHYAKKNNNTGVAYDATQAAITRPSDHNNLWGDDAIERMNISVGANTYRAPFFVGANPANDPTLHEPDGMSRLIASPEVQGATTPDFNTFCLDCHVNIVGAYTAIDWSFTGNQHGGRNDGASGFGTRIAPYTIDGTSGTLVNEATNFVLSCLDCHEPHGIQEANNAYLLRTTVNGTSGITFSSNTAWYNFCAACHDLSTHAVILPTSSCYGVLSCHSHAAVAF